jgi:hypothetical protein
MVRRCVRPGRNWDDIDLKVIIDELHSGKIIDTVTQVRWHRARITRNKAIHLNPPPDPPEVQQLIDLLDLSGRDTPPTKR